MFSLLSVHVWYWSSKPVQICTYPHETPRKSLSERPNKHVQIRAPTPPSVSSEQEQTYTNSHPLVEDTPAEGLPAARGVQIRVGLEPADLCHGHFLHWNTLCTKKVELRCAHTHAQFCRRCVITRSCGNHGVYGFDSKYWKVQYIEGGCLQRRSSPNRAVFVVSSVNTLRIVTLNCNEQNNACVVDIRSQSDLPVPLHYPPNCVLGLRSLPEEKARHFLSMAASGQFRLAPYT